MIRGRLRDIAAIAGVVTFVGLGAVFAPQAQATPTPTNTNETAYWENLYGQQFPNLQCYKHDGDKDSNAHGYIDEVDGHEAVFLNTFNPDWYGDKFVLLIVKGGSSGNGGVVDENMVYVNPASNTPYVAPTGSNDQIKDVSHWIVCKGYNSVVTTTTVEETTTTTEPETTTTTAPETTTTTVGETTTTTVQETTTTTEPQTTTTTEPETTTTTVEETTTTTAGETTTTTVEETTTTTVGDTTTTAGDTTTSEVVTSTVPSSPAEPTIGSLPVTGLNPIPIAMVGVGLAGLGTCAVLQSRRMKANA